MKIYLAGTLFRENMNLNRRLKVKNHLESYVTLNEKTFEKVLKNLLGERNESTDKRIPRNS